MLFRCDAFDAWIVGGGVKFGRLRGGWSGILPVSSAHQVVAPLWVPDSDGLGSCASCFVASPGTECNHMNTQFKSGLLTGLPREEIVERYRKSPGNEIESGKFQSPESSSALAANAFGYFLGNEKPFPPLDRVSGAVWPPISVLPEVECRFPWSGGRHPWLDILIETGTTVIGIESKRYEPFRSKQPGKFAEAYKRDVWGRRMGRFCRLRDDIAGGKVAFGRLDAVQLVKHAFGLRTVVHREESLAFGKTPWLVYLYAEPGSWPDGTPVDAKTKADHRREIANFSRRVEGDEVRFTSMTYRELLETWLRADDAGVRSHASAVKEAFSL